MKNLIILISIATISISCQETIVLDLKDYKERIVIEGQVTNHAGYQYVRVTRTAEFYYEGFTPRVSNATVLVSDDLGNEFSFNHNPGNQEDSVGYYLPDELFIGDVGRTYTLSVKVDEQVYTAKDELFSVSNIDSLSYRVNTKEQEEPKEQDKYYECLLFTKEPKDVENYYFFRFYRNDSLKIYGPTDIYFADDKALAESIDGIGSPVFYGVKDVARIEFYSLSRDGFIYFNDLSNLLNSDGGVFSQPPSNCRTNLTNGALGFFQVSAVDIREIVIE